MGWAKKYPVNKDYSVFFLSVAILKKLVRTDIVNLAKGDYLFQIFQAFSA